MAVDVFNVGETLTAQNVDQRLADLAVSGFYPCGIQGSSDLKFTLTLPSGVLRTHRTEPAQS
jgi:hypothetical protein